MNWKMFFALPLVLVACGSPKPDDLPEIPRLTRPSQPACSAAASAQFAKRPGMEFVTFEQPKPTAQLKTQGVTFLPDTAQSMLYTTKARLNTEYYGTDTKVDLPALHAKYAAEFRKQCKNGLAKCPITEATDQLMGKYFDEIKDNHTYYLDAASYSGFSDQRSGNNQPTPSFGFSYRPVPSADGAVIRFLRAEGPAFAAGLKRGDVLLEVDGKVLTRLATDQATLESYIDTISKAAVKTAAVNIRYRRGNIERTLLLQGAVFSAASLPWGTVLTDATLNRYYYIYFPTFGSSGASQVINDLVAQAQSANVRGIIVDLRYNGGGLVSEMIGASSVFSSTATVRFNTIDADDFTFRAQNSKVQIFSRCFTQPFDIFAINNPVQWAGKVAILTTGNSASASEFFSYILRQDLGNRVRVIGAETFGVGNSFTTIQPAPGERGMAVTGGIAYSATGTELPASVVPDEAQLDDLAQLAQGTDLGLNAAFNFLR
jgi:carboxyl-terminal processing protease